MNLLEHVWVVAELAEVTGRDENSVLQWIKRQCGRLPTNQRGAFARQTTGKRAIWLVNRDHVLVQAYIVKNGTSKHHNAPEE